MKAYRYLAAAVGLAFAMAGCAVHQTETPGLTGPSQVALAVDVSSSPQTITQNGSDAAVVTAKVYFTDPTTGQTRPKANLPVRFDMRVNGVLQDFGTLSARSSVTDASGLARTTYTAPPASSTGTTGTVSIVASVTDATVANPANTDASNFATISLVPPGVILPPAASPTPSFIVTPSPVTVSTPVTFDASASTPGNGASSITTYSWSFGDGGSGTGKTATHTFNSGNTYSVTLTVTNDRGLSASTTQSVTVTFPNAPTADFVFSPSSPIAGQTVFFTADTSKSATGHNIVQYSWTWGDGTTDSGLAVSHVFTTAGAYTVVLSVADDAGQKSSKSTQVTVGSGNPIGAFTAVNTGGHTMQFDASGSTAFLGASIVSYSWAFGDGSFSGTLSNAVTSHAYGAANTYQVRLTVTDSNGRTGVITQTVSVP